MYLLLLFGLIAIAVWATIITPRISLIVVCGLFLILAGLLNYDIVRFELGFTTLTVDRLMLAVLLSVFGVQWIRKKTEPRDIPASEWLLLGFLAVLVVNTFTNDWRNPGFEQSPVLPHLFEGYLIPFALYWIARRANIQKRGVDILYAMFAVFGVYLAVTAILEVAGAWQLVFPRKIGDPLAGIHFGRARGPFLQSVRLGLYLLVSLFATWIPLVTERRWGRGGQLLGFAMLGLYAAAIYATYTRSVWLAFIIAGLSLAVLAWPVRLRRVVIFASIFAIVGGVVVTDALLSVKRETTAEESKESTEMRAVFAYVSWKMFQDKPLTGFG
ncbi:MAG: O-antigen ligase family protein, partial [Planctomycetota bacterium]